MTSCETRASRTPRASLKADVPVKQLRVPGQMHGFFTMVNVLPGSKVGIDFAVEAIQSALASG